MDDKTKNLELYASLTSCENDLLELININFFKIDSTWNLRTIDVVSELPTIANKGDVYFLQPNIYSSEYSIEIYSGTTWYTLELKEGMRFFNLADGFYYLFNNGVLERVGNVKGPTSSLKNSVAIFDSESGQFITDSGVFIEDHVSLYAQNIYSENIYSENIYGENIVSIYSDTEYLEAENANIDKLNVKFLTGEQTQVEKISSTEIK